MNRIVAERGMKLYAGTPVDSPKRLSLSFMAALTESRYGAALPRQSVVTADQLAERLIAAAEAGNEPALDSACAAVVDFLSAEQLNGLLTKHHIYELISSIYRKANDEGLEIEKSDINALVLLPDMTMIASDLKKLLQTRVNVAREHRIAGDDTAKLIVEYVIANAYDPDINLQDMSEEFGLSADYISSMIKRETGSAFKEYLTMLRIGEARRLLMEDKTLTVNDVAARIGYRKASNFSKKFKELTGMLPSQVRRGECSIWSSKSQNTEFLPPKSGFPGFLGALLGFQDLCGQGCMCYCHASGRQPSRTSSGSNNMSERWSNMEKTRMTPRKAVSWTRVRKRLLKSWQWYVLLLPAVIYVAVSQRLCALYAGYLR
ncbi:MAG: AraC family transcriptional regulator [Eubacteriales bacterium]|nr:AraC family transcriptional regulator [Eubacteriales bacterium]